MWRVFENRVLKQILGPKRDEVTGKWRKLHNEELNDLYCSTNIIRVTKKKEMSGACSMYGRLEKWRNLRERDHLEVKGVNGRIDLILKWMIKKWDTEA